MIGPSLDEYFSSTGPGQSRSGLICPFCSGGTSHDKSFSVSRSVHTLLYKCHRATCAAKGVYNATRAYTSSDARSDQQRGGERRSVYTGKLGELPGEVRETLRTRYFLGDEQVQRAGLKWAPTLNRVWMPCFDHFNKQVGATARSLEKDVVPKTRTYWEEDSYPKLSFYGTLPSHTLLIVEDQLSAIRTSRFVPTASLLGTNLNFNKAEVLFKVAKRLIVALDKDATSEACNIVRNNGYMFEEIRICSLEKDFKNLTDLEIQHKLRPFLPLEIKHEVNLQGESEAVSHAATLP